MISAVRRYRKFLIYTEYSVNKKMPRMSLGVVDVHRLHR
jgi:hypothetical protein